MRINHDADKISRYVCPSADPSSNSIEMVNPNVGPQWQFERSDIDHKL